MGAQAQRVGGMKIIGYELVNEDLTNLGGPMGTEYTVTRWRRYFDSAKKAKAAAVKDHEAAIEWHKMGHGYRSNDLGHTMYYIAQLILN